MPIFSDYCNEKLETRGNRGIRQVDDEVSREVMEGIREESVVEIERLVEMVDELLEIEDDAMEQLAKARVMVVITWMLERMTTRERMYAMRFFDEEIPSYREARRRYDELNNEE